MSGYLLDTHVWLWLIGGVEDSLRSTDRAMLEGAARRGELFLSAISVWETAQKASKGRLQMQASIEELMEVSFGDGSIRLLDLTTGILIAANRLPGKIHGDPADRILAATARLRECVIVTHDIELRRYGKQGHVQIHKV